jgi:hypothetical protein
MELNPDYTQLRWEMSRDHAVHETNTARRDDVITPAPAEMLRPGEVRPDWPHPKAEPIATVRRGTDSGPVPVVKI